MNLIPYGMGMGIGMGMGKGENIRGISMGRGIKTTCFPKPLVKYWRISCCLYSRIECDVEKNLPIRRKASANNYCRYDYNTL